MNQILNIRTRLLEIGRKIGEPEEAERELREWHGRVDEHNSQAFDELMEEALKNDEIQEGANKAGLHDDFLRASLKERASRIWEAAAGEMETYISLERGYEARKRGFGNPDKERFRQRTYGVLLYALTAILIISAAVVIGFLLFIFLGSLLDPGYDTLIMLGVTAALIALCVVLISRLRRAFRVRNNRLAEIEQYEQEIGAITERLNSAGQAVEKSVIEKGMLPELRSIINSQLAPSYDTALPVRDAPGLAEVFNPEYEIATEPKDRLYHLLSGMPGGSIGVAGPRGAGKTTLLGAFCRKESTNELKGRPVLSVMIPAPVEYDAREFILHIFASVCQRLLELKGKVLPSPWEDMEDAQGPPPSFFVRIVGLRETLAFFGLGVILIALGLYLELYLKARVMGVNPELVYNLGFFLAALGLLGLVIQGLHIRRHRDRATRGDSEADRDEPLVKTARGHLQEIRFQQSYSSGWGGSLSVPIAQLTAEARVDAAVTLARHQLSLPEIMDHYRNFIGRVHKEYEIVIGIDELDKIGSDEQVQRFLNEIKALFGLEGCFYLVSVSESALSSFERRGLPIRDVFDSSFDAIVHVNYLDLNRAQQLLRRRVIGVPVPFLDFCHCMAGGLPRDLIRVFRDLFEDRRQASTGADDLSTLCSSLIRSDVKSKLRAASIEARDITLEAEAGQLFNEIRKLEAALASPDHSSGKHKNLLEAYQKLLHIAHQEGEMQAGPADIAAKRKSVTSLITELGVYLYYCSTLLEFFGAESFSERRLQQAESSGALDQLCRARQSFTISPRIAESVITEFRESYKLDIPSAA